MTEQEYRDDLISKIGRVSEIVNGMGKSKAWELVVEDVSKNLEQIDKSWHLIPDSADWTNKLRELRLAKMSSEYIVKLVEIYKHELDRLQNELFKLDNKEVEINKDYDER